MAAVTTTIIALGGLGLSVAQTIKANKDMKLASKNADEAQKKMEGIKEQNQFKSLQVPTLGMELAQDAQAQRDAQALNAIQGAGAAGVIGGVGQVAQVGMQQDLALSAKAQESQFDRDLKQAEAGQGIESRRQERELKIGLGAKTDAEARLKEARAAKTAGINSMFKTGGQAILGVGNMYKAANPTDPYAVSEYLFKQEA